MRRINIFQFLPYYPPHKGWLETHAQERAQQWVKNWFWKVINITANIWTSYEAENKIFKEEKKWIITYYLPSIEIIPNFPVYKFWNKEVKNLLKEIKNEINNSNQNRIIITRTRFFLTSLIWWIFYKLNFRKNKNVKRVHIEHGSWYVKLSSKFKTLVAWLYDKIFGKWIFKKSDLVIPISNACKNFILQLGWKNTNLWPVIYRWFDFWKKSEEVLKKSEETEKITEWKKEWKIILWFVGRLYKWKWVENIIKGLQKITMEEIWRKFWRTLKKKIKFIIVGDGEDLEYLKNLVKDLWLEDIIYFIWWKPFEEALAIQSLFDIHIHSSLPWWGLSGTLIQWMRGAPVIVSSLNEWAKEILKGRVLKRVQKRSEENSKKIWREDKGIAILIWNKENYTIEDMQNAILKGVEAFEEWEDFRKINRPFIKKTFDWEKNIGKYYNEFNNLFKTS